MLLRDITPEGDPHTYRRAKELIGKMVPAPYDCLDDEFIRRQGWIAVVIASADHFDAEYAENISRACQDAGYSSLLSINAEGIEFHFSQQMGSGTMGYYPTAENLSAFEQDPELTKKSVFCQWVPATKDGLLEFSDRLSALEVLLTTEDASFAILCTKGDFIIIAGPQPFVENALGTDVESARGLFREFAESLISNPDERVNDFVERERRRYLGVADRYAALDPG